MFKNKTNLNINLVSEICKTSQLTKYRIQKMFQISWKALELVSKF